MSELLRKDVDVMKKRRQQMDEVMKELDKPVPKMEKLEPKPEDKKGKKGISTKNSPMKKPWGFLCKD